MTTKKIILIIAVVLLFFSTLVVALNKNGDTVYLKFSLSKFESQRKFIREYFSDEIEEINESPTFVNDIDFAIAVMDINDDGMEDILVVILHPYFSGYQNNGLFAVFTSGEEEMKYVPFNSNYS